MKQLLVVIFNFDMVANSYSQLTRICIAARRENYKKILVINSQIEFLLHLNCRLHKEFCIQDDKELSQSSVSTITTRQSFASHLEKKLGSKEPDVTSGELNLEEVVVSQGSGEIASILDRILDTSHVNSTFEACKLKAYIRECWDVQNIDDEFPTGVHPDRYQEFVGGMAQYIIDKQLTHQRESLSYDMVYVGVI